MPTPDKQVNMTCNRLHEHHKAQLGVGAVSSMADETDIRDKFQGRKSTYPHGQKGRGRPAYPNPAARAGSPTYKAVENARQRCTNQRHPQFKDYGGRGIKCLVTVLDVLEDIGPRPDPAICEDTGKLVNYSLDRISFDGDYQRGNIRWATPHQQAVNRRSNTFLELDGETLPIKEWALVKGIPASTISTRIARGWSPAAALSKPVMSPQEVKALKRKKASDKGHHNYRVFLYDQALRQLWLLTSPHVSADVRAELSWKDKPQAWIAEQADIARREIRDLQNLEIGGYQTFPLPTYPFMIGEDNMPYPVIDEDEDDGL